MGLLRVRFPTTNGRKGFSPRLVAAHVRLTSSGWPGARSDALRTGTFPTSVPFTPQVTFMNYPNSLDSGTEIVKGKRFAVLHYRPYPLVLQHSPELLGFIISGSMPLGAPEEPSVGFWERGITEEKTLNFVKIERRPRLPTPPIDRRNACGLVPPRSTFRPCRTTRRQHHLAQIKGVRKVATRSI